MSTRPSATPPGSPGAAVSSSEPAGELSLRIEEKSGRSYAAHQFHRGALRVLRPHYMDDTGQVAYTIINPGGAYFGRDEYQLDVVVADSAALTLTTQSATKVYKTPQGPARQHLRVELGPDATLEYVPDQLIVYRGGSYRQDTLVRMDPTASVLLCEVITPGWSPTGASFAYDDLRMRTEITVAAPGRDRRLVVDNLRVHPGEGVDITGIGVMEGHSHTGQFLVADRRLDQQVFDRLAAIVEASDTHSGITHAGLEPVEGVHCVSVRSLAESTARITELHHRLANELRSLWRGQPPLALRKP